MQKVYLISLYLTFSLFMLFMILTKGRHVQGWRKISLGLMIMLYSAPAAVFVSCKTGQNREAVQKDIWQTEGWVDENTWRVTSSGKADLKLKDETLRRVSARRNAILNVQYMIIERLNNQRYESCHGTVYEPESQCAVMAAELKAIIKKGNVVYEEFDSEGNSWILYEVKSNGLKNRIALFESSYCTM